MLWRRSVKRCSAKSRRIERLPQSSLRTDFSCHFFAPFSSWWSWVDTPPESQSLDHNDKKNFPCGNSSFKNMFQEGLVVCWVKRRSYEVMWRICVMNLSWSALSIIFIKSLYYMTLQTIGWAYFGLLIFSIGEKTEAYFVSIKTVFFGGGGWHNTTVSTLASGPSCPGLDSWRSQ